ncbi:MAG: glycosyltransferase family 2 protein [Verrucomicrobia bacterium]|nr:glycosyltransferase family 2 protein [Verrucomicrobiota bacterium]
MSVAISIIVPVFNEAANIQRLACEVTAALAGEPRLWELIFVDDASRDETWIEIVAAHAADGRVRGLRHARNAGQSAALWSGMQATDAEVIATLDGDLQNDPADLPKLLRELASADFVMGVRLARQDNFLRLASSEVARWARRAVLGVDFRDTGCSLRAFRRSALNGVFPFNGLHRFLPILVHGNGSRMVEVPVHHRPRVAGVSKYGVWNRLGRGLVDLFAVAWYQRRRLPVVPLAEVLAASPAVKRALDETNFASKVRDGAAGR